MRTTLNLIFFLLLLSPASAGTGWPGVPYVQAKVYLYNLKGALFGKHSPVKDLKPDPTMVMPGKVLTPEQLVELQKFLKGDLALLQEGLAGCYIPHHAIVFYDAQNTPVAWMSVCFMCTGIRLYHPVPRPAKVVYNKKTEADAYRKIEVLKKIVTGAGLPVFDRPEEYNKFDTRRLAAENIKTIVDSAFVAKYFPEKFPITSLHGIISTTDSLPMIETQRFEKQNASGDVFVFSEVKYQSSRFWFSGRKGSEVYLDQAQIADQEIVLIEAFKIGTDVEKLFRSQGITETALPEKLMITNGVNRAIRFSFDGFTITGYELFTVLP